MFGIDALLEFWPLLTAMFVLLGFSAFFSASEAAMFSLHERDRALLGRGGIGQRRAHVLLQDPDRLLSAVLFWNLVVNIAYFALASQVAIRLQKSPQVSNSLVAGYTAGSLLVIIFFSEMLPKSFAVLQAASLASRVSIPLGVMVRLVDPLMPLLRLINLLSRRLFWPGFRPEDYLQVEDIERAIELSSDDAQLIEQERLVLNNLVSLTELRVDECMRPRNRLRLFRPPISWASVATAIPNSGFVFVTEPDCDDIVSLVPLNDLSDIPDEHLEYYAQPVVYAPWCAMVADVLQLMDDRRCDAVVVVDEWGSTVGALTRNDVWDMVFTRRSSRSERLLNLRPIRPLGVGMWQVTGLSNLRTLEMHFAAELPETSSVTVAGVVQESLQRMPTVNDQCEWGPFRFTIIAAEEDEPFVAWVELKDDTEDAS